MNAVRFLTCSLVWLSACGGAVDDATNGAGRPGAMSADPTGGNSKDGTPSSSGGASTRPSPSLERVCNPMRPILEDFEKALDPSWLVTNPSGLNLDTQQPIGGTQSLKVSMKAGAQPYLTIPLPSVCRLEIRLKIQPDAEFLASNLTDVVRVNAGPSMFHLVVKHGGMLEFYNEYHDSATGAGLGGGAFGKLLPDTMATIVFLVDVVARQFTGSVTTEGLPPSYLSAATVVESGSITSIDVGSAPGWPSIHVDYSSSGNYSLDDLALR